MWEIRVWLDRRPAKGAAAQSGGALTAFPCTPHGTDAPGDRGHRLWRPPGAGGPCPPLRGWPGQRLSPRSPGDAHRLQEAQGAHVVPLGAQDLVEDAEAEAQLALRLPGGCARAGAGSSGAGDPGVGVGTVPSPVAAGIAAAGYLHSTAAARRPLLPPRGGRAERRLRRPGAPSRTGRAGWPGSAAGPAPGAAGGRDRGRAARAGGGGSGGGGMRGGEGLALGAPRRRAPLPPPPPRQGSVCQVPRRAEAAEALRAH